MDRTPRVGLVVAASVFLCALAAVLIGGLGMAGVSSVSSSNARLANDELVTAHVTAQLAHTVDTVYADSLAAAIAIPLVLHGSSGVPDDQLRLAVHAGIRKVNVGTALNIAYTVAVRDVLAVDPGGVDPRPYLAAGRDAVAATVAELCRVGDGR